MEAPSIAQGVRLDTLNWRFISGLMVVTMGLALVLMLASDIFVVRGVSITGNGYLSPSVIFTYSGIAEQHVLRIDPRQVERTLIEIPTIAEAQVTLGWPPELVRIRIVEREPALLWVQAGVEAWVDIHGRVLTAPLQDRPDLLKVVTRGVEEPVSLSSRVPQDVVDGARQLEELIPTTRRLRYDPFLGLGFRDDRGWEAWFGSGLDMPIKILVYRQMVDELLSQGITPSIVNVSNPDAPYCSGC